MKNPIKAISRDSDMKDMMENQTSKQHDDSAYVLAIDAGGTYFKSVLVSSNGVLIADSFLQTPVHFSGSKSEIIGTYEKVFVASLQFARLHRLSIAGIGISTPGPFNYIQGTSLMDHKFKSIKNIPLRDEFAKLDCFNAKIPVTFQQDVHSFLIGEQWIGAIKGVANAAAITLGTGLGLGLMKDSTILDNGHGGPHTVIFNRPFEGGILEDRISRRGIISQYCKYANRLEKNIDVHEIAFNARKNKDVPAQKVFMEAGTILADELAEIFRTLSIKDIVFGGQISKSFVLFAPSFKEKLQEKGINANVVPGRNIEFSTLIGAARAVIDIKALWG